jgi:hypothetical protein
VTIDARWRGRKARRPADGRRAVGHGMALRDVEVASHPEKLAESSRNAYYEMRYD